MSSRSAQQQPGGSVRLARDGCCCLRSSESSPPSFVENSVDNTPVKGFASGLSATIDRRVAARVSNEGGLRLRRPKETYPHPSRTRHGRPSMPVTATAARCATTRTACRFITSFIAAAAAMTRPATSSRSAGAAMRKRTARGSPNVTRFARRTPQKSAMRPTGCCKTNTSSCASNTSATTTPNAGKSGGPINRAPTSAA